MNLRLFVVMTQYLQSSFNTRKELVDRDPGNTQWQNDLATSGRQLGEALETAADLIDSGVEFDPGDEPSVDESPTDGLSADRLRESALSAYGMASVILASLMVHEPERGSLRHGFLAAIGKAGRLLEAQGRAEEALTTYRSARDLVRSGVPDDAISARSLDDLEAIEGSIARLEATEDSADNDESDSDESGPMGRADE